MPRRERWAVLGEVLRAMEDELRASGEGYSITRVGSRANVPHDRLLVYLEEMAQVGLVTRDKPPRITSDGQEFLQQYKRLRDVLDRYGLG